MAFKEKIKTFGRKVKAFWKDHWEEVVLISGGVALTGAACYGMYRSGKKQMDDYYEWRENTQKELEEEAEEALKTIEEKTAWNKDWDEMARTFELDTHQPLGSYMNGYTEEEGYVDPLEGNCFIIAGPNSYYNDDPDNLDFYVLDNEGYFHRMPEDVYSA